MLVILDSNEYIFALGTIRKATRERLIEEVSQHTENITARITRLIVDEVRNNSTPEAFKEFMIFINKLTAIDEEFMVPFELGAKYELAGFKPADAFITAYTEYVGADILVSENRHFLHHHSSLPFILNKVINCDFSFAVILNEVKNLTDVNRRFFATAQNDTITNCDLPQYRILNAEKCLNLIKRPLK